MSGSHRRSRWFSSWRLWRRPSAMSASSNQPPGPRTASGTISPRWSTGATRELPVLRLAPLMTRAQLHRGNGGRWPR